MRLVALFICLLLSWPASAQEERLLVFAAASLTDALTDAAAAFEKSGGQKPVLSFAASSALARQIENGAPAQIFVSADEPWMDYLADRKLIDPATRVSFLANRIVLIAPAGQPLSLEIGVGFPLAQTLGRGKLALADPDAVPAGRYSRAALENLGVWRSVEGNVVRAENVRAALTFVERGEAAAGIVYATDAAVVKGVTIVGTFPETSHLPISYPVALIAGQESAAAKAFHAFMLSEAAKAIYTQYGFIVK